MKKYRAYFSNGSTRVIKIFDSGKFEIEDDSGFFSRITSKGKGSLKTALEVASVEVGADIKEVKELQQPNQQEGRAPINKKLQSVIVPKVWSQ